MKRLLLLLLSCLLVVTLAWATPQQDSETTGKRAHPRVQHHRAHKAKKHRAPKRPRHRV